MDTSNFRCRLRLGLLLVSVWALSAQRVAAQERSQWQIAFHYGMAESFSSNLLIRQHGQPDIFFFADYASLSLALPPYWMWRVGYHRGSRGWEFETIHHKLYVANAPDEVGYFSISHGYNFLFLNHARRLSSGYTWRVGLGTALAHAENEVRGKALDETKGLLELGYYLTGPTVQLSFGRSFRLGRYGFANTEAKLCYGYAEVPVVDGFARLHNLSVHWLIGLGMHTGKQ